MWNTYCKKVTILDKDTWIKKLLETFQSFSQTLPVYLHPECREELKQLLLASGSETAFLKKLKEFLGIISSHPKTFTNANGLEKPKGESDIYSMRFLLTDKNICLLFAIQDGCLLCLIAFHERSGKKVSSYSSYFPDAHARLEDMTK